MEGIKIIKLDIAYDDLIKDFYVIGEGASKRTFTRDDVNFVLKAPIRGTDRDLFDIFEAGACKIPATGEEMRDYADELSYYNIASIHGQLYAELFIYNSYLKKSRERVVYDYVLKNMLARIYCGYITSDGVLLVKQEKADISCAKVPHDKFTLSSFFSAFQKVAEIEENEREYFKNILDVACQRLIQKKYGDKLKQIDDFYEARKYCFFTDEKIERDMRINDLSEQNIGFFKDKIKIFDYGIIGCYDINDYYDDEEYYDDYEE